MARHVLAAVCLSVAYLSFVLAAHAETGPGNDIDRQNVCPLLISSACGVLHETKYHVPRRPTAFSPTELRFALPDGRSGTAAFISAVSTISATSTVDNHPVAMKADRESVLPESLNRGLGATIGGALWGHLLLWIAVGIGGLAGLLAIWSLILRGRVKRGTAELSASNEGPVKKVAERNEAEKRQQESEQLLGLLFEHANDGVNVAEYNPLTGKRRLVSCNQRYVELSGYSREELMAAENLNELVEYQISPEERRAWRGNIIDGVPFHGTGSWKRPDGKENYYEWTAAPMKREGRLLIFGVDRDVTERKRAEDAIRESEERYRVLFDGAVEGILIADTQTKMFQYANSAICRLLGYTQEELERLGVRDIHPREDLDHVISEFEAQSRGEKSLAAEIPCLRKDGGLAYADIVSSRIRIDGKACNIGFFSDVTERRRAESEREELEAQLLHAQKMEAIGTLAGGVAHDFNNLLTGILGYANLLMLESSSGEVTEIARSIEEAARRAAQLTEQLLGFARKGKYQNMPINMHETIRDVAELLSRAIGKGVTVRDDLQAAQDGVLGDPGQMHQMILNLAVNARDAMPDGGELTIATEQVDLDEPYCRIRPEVSPGPHLVVSVGDTGTGIPTDIRERIFEPFFTTKEHGKGTGMGLAMVYGIVKNHGGTINLESEVGRGTTFHILLPLVQQQQGRSVAVTAGRPVRGKGRVLVVDDEEVVRHTAARLLRQVGYKVMTAADGKEAVNCYREFGPQIDLVILDMAMPRMDGRCCFRALREMDVGVRVLMSTGYSLDGAAQGILSEGVIGFIQKPYDLQRLSEAVAAALGSDNMTGAGEPAGQRQPPKRAAR